MHKRSSVFTEVLKLWLIGAAFFTVSPVWAASFQVTPDADDSVDSQPGDGICANAEGLCSLRAAIMESNSLAGADLIMLPPGTYRLTLATTNENGAINGDLDILDSVTIIGQSRETTIIDGNGVDRVFHIKDPDEKGTIDVTINSLTITGGNPQTFVSNGGGINNEGGYLIVSDVIIEGNSASSGGGINNNNTASNAVFGTFILSNSIVRNNRATLFNGGGIQNLNGEMSIVNSVVEGNSAPTDQSSGGGEFVLSTGGRGGGIYNAANLSLTYVTVKDNVGSSGGGIANFPGAGFSGDETILEIFGSAIINNRATHTESWSVGGGIYNVGAKAKVIMTNSTLSGNEALSRDENGNILAMDSQGGGIYNSSGLASSVVLRNVTIAENIAGEGSGIYQNVDSNGTISIMNSIVANNLLQDIDSVNPVPGGNCSNLVMPAEEMNANNYNLESGSSCSFDLNNVDPYLQALEIEAGSMTETHRIDVGSPAIDAGNPGGCTTFEGDDLSVDQRGFLRHTDGDGDNIERCDIGAYEAGSLGPAILEFKQPTYTINENDANGFATLIVQRTGNSVGEVSVRYRLAESDAGTAWRGTHYSFTESILTWGDGDMEDKSITINIINDTVFTENKKTVILELYSESGKAIIAGNEKAILEIIEDEKQTDPTPPPSSGSGGGEDVERFGGGGLTGLLMLFMLFLPLFFRRPFFK